MRLLFLMSLIWPVLAFGQEQVQDRFISRPVDHRLPQGEHFQLKYQVLKGEKVPNSAPVMFFLGNELGQNADVLLKRQKQFGGEHDMIYVQVDHRGYGSYAPGDQSFPAYVNPEEAVEDFDAVIQKLRAEFTGPVIVVGYSYSGGLAVKLALAHPEDMALVVNSSGVLANPFVFDAHDRFIRQSWPQDLVKSLEGRVADLKPSALLDQTWRDRQLVEIGMVGTIQYASSQPIIPAFRAWEPKTAPEFVAALRDVDAKHAGNVLNDFTNSQAVRQVSLADAQTQKFHGRFYAYEQCFEIGTFYVSNGPTKLFSETEADYLDFCEQLFGRRPVVKPYIDLRPQLASLKVPLINVIGERDPWSELGARPSDKLGCGENIFVPGGFHGPDRDSADVTKQVIEAVFKYLPFAGHGPNCDRRMSKKGETKVISPGKN